MRCTHGWPTDHFASRDRFVALARAAGARTASHPIEARGPRGEPLRIDVAALGPERPEHLVVLVSGVHGVEGPLGACIQARALQDAAREGLPDGAGLLLVHAANPWGVAHGRRVDERNVDMNRNFIDPDGPRPASPARYAALDPIINPVGAPRPGDAVRFWARAARLIVADRGLRGLGAAIAEGQHEFPRGLFFAGRETGEACRLLQGAVRDRAARANRVTVLDVHSGLGPSGVATLIARGDAEDADALADRLRAHYGQPVVIDGADGNAYAARGTFALWCRGALADRRPLYLCVELGTVGPLRVLRALRRENRAHHWCEPGSAERAAAARALADAFAPRSPRWRAKAVAQGLHVLERTLRLPVDAGRDA